VIEPVIHDKPLPYVSNLELRSTDSINLIVIHCTELPDLTSARDYGERVRYSESGTGNSGHYYIERNGAIEQWVPKDRVAHHVRGYNERSMGIELDNNGRYPEWFDSRRQVMTEVYPLPQINSLLDLILRLSAELPNLEWISGHESLDTSRVPATDRPDLQVFRKRDPGPLFPWNEILPIIRLRRLLPE